LFAALLVGCQSTPDASSPSAVATVQSSQGKAEYRRAGSDWQPAQAGLNLSSGDELRTDSAAELIINFGKEAGILTLHPGSTLRIDSLTSASPGEAPVTLTLGQGRITGDTLRAPGTPKVQVHTGKGSIKVP
ncbi:MAG TPA: hypothetical protein VM735_01170, partial [Candidatus Kapabacteria bacterium]|nr:hypothetical protein [Candidatus Kapabacteria bacterium]